MSWICRRSLSYLYSATGLCNPKYFSRGFKSCILENFLVLFGEVSARHEGFTYIRKHKIKAKKNKDLSMIREEV